MNKLRNHALILFLCIAAISVSCASPAGSIGGSGGTAAGGDELYTVPRRLLYEINDTFKRNSDLAVYTSTGGDVTPISVDQVDISVVEDPENAADVTSPVPKDQEYLLTSEGRKLILVNYRNMETWYSIEVGDPYGVGDTPDDGGGNEGGSGITIIWK